MKIFARILVLIGIFAPTLFSVYNKNYGTLYCQLYGVAAVSKSFKRDICEISDRAIREMRHFSMQYVRNKIYLEQQYRLGYKNGWCFLQKGHCKFTPRCLLVTNARAIPEEFQVFIAL